MRGERFAADCPDLASYLAETLPASEITGLRDQVRDAVATTAGTAVVSLQADVCRITFPGEPGGTPAHQDSWYLRQPGLWVAWIPLVDCPLPVGPLEVAPGAGGPGPAPHDENGIAGPVPEESWRVLPCRRGDVVIFSGSTIHRSRPNRSVETVRLSVDIRFAAKPPG